MAYVPIQAVVPTFFDTTGAFLSGGSIKALVSGTTTATAMYKDSAGTSAGTTVNINAYGQPHVSGTPIQIYLNTAVAYDFELYDGANGTGSLVRPKWIAGYPPDNGLRAALAASTGAALVGLSQGGTVQDAIKWVTPEMYGAVVGADCSDALENWLNSSHRYLMMGRGEYRVSRPLVVTSSLSYKRIVGYDGFNDAAVSSYASIIKGTHAGVIISYTAIDFTEISHIKFTGAGCSALKQTTLANYTSTAHIHHCDFDASLTECIYANLILCKIEDNLFGYHGTPGAAHRHIYCEGGISSANYTNVNRIINNRCYQAVGNFSMEFKNGDRLLLQGNNFEQNDCPPLKITGIEYVTINGHNWFEENAVGAGTPYEIYIQDGDASHPVRSLIVDGNNIGPHSSMTHFIYSTSTSLRVQFTNNNGTGWTSKAVTYYGGTNDGGLTHYYNNTLSGYSRGNYNVTKPLNDAFHAYHDNGVADITGNGGTPYTIPYNVIAQSNIGTFDSSTYTHTAAVSGMYNYNVGLNITGILNTHTTMAVNLVTSNRTYSTSVHPYNMANAAGGLGMTFNFQAYMDSGDTALVQITISGGTKVVDLTTLTNWFSGAHVG